MSNINVYPKILIFESLEFIIIYLYVDESFRKAMTEILFLYLNEEYVNRVKFIVDT